MTSRITKSTTGRYDQVVALTQWLINRGIDALYTEVHKNRPEVLTTNALRRDGSGISDLVFGAPKIIIDAQPGNLSQVFYRLHLQSGNLKMFASENPSDKGEIQYSIKDWYFAFPVNIGLVGLDAESEKYKTIRETMNKPGDYSISQLLVDMTTAQFGIPSAKYSSYGEWTQGDRYYTMVKNKETNVKSPPKFVLGQKRIWEQEDQHVQNQFQRFIQDCTTTLLEEGFNDLGSVAVGDAKTIKEEEHPATFLPSDVRFQTYPWIDPWVSNYMPKTGLEGDARLNYLCYLEMTEGAPPPPPTEKTAWLEASNGNWTDGRDPNSESPSKFGTYVLTGRKFLDKFFLPKLKGLNAVVTSDVHKPSVNVNAEFWTVGWSFWAPLDIGVNMDNASDKFAFKRRPNATSSIEDIFKTAGGTADDAQKEFQGALNMTTLPTNALAWIYKNIDTPEQGYDEDKSQLLYNAYIRSNSSTHTVVRVSIVPGTNYITLEGRSFIDITMSVDPGWAAGDVNESLHSVAKWKVVFTMAECMDGGLAVTLNIERPSVEVSVSPSDSSIMPSVKEFIERSYSTAGQNFEALTSQLKNALEGQEKFYFPSKGVFFFKNPLFNHQGDLVCEIAYNENTTTKTPNQGSAAVARDIKEAPELKAMPKPEDYFTEYTGSAEK